MPCCVKCHSLDCIGCGNCPEYSMDDDGLPVESDNTAEYINHEFDADPFGVTSEDIIEETFRRR